MSDSDSEAWLEPWYPVSNEASKAALRAELRREVGPQHPLRKVAAEPIARSSVDDDVLYRLPDGQVALVHLTWHGKEEKDPRWPTCDIFPDLPAWIEAIMKPDHRSRGSGKD